ncbi:MAG TPA: glutamate racemase [Treponema sp.]|nr:glutamate racemase [Treponema sp.]
MKDYIDFAFLDSGTGGIPYMLELKKKSPDSRCVYLGDTAHFPYGEKTSEEITLCASQALSLIVKKWNPRTVIIACNTISVTSLADLRALFPNIPIVGTVPAIKLAASVTHNKRIGLLATNATVNHPYNKKLIQDYAKDCHVFNRGDPDLIAFIEHELFNASEAEKQKAVEPAVSFFLENKCDTIILGCTHFTHIAENIASVAGSGVQVVDSRDGVANQALRVEQKQIAVSVQQKARLDTLPPDQSFFVTALHNTEDDREYAALCKNAGIPWGGLITNA